MCSTKELELMSKDELLSHISKVSTRLTVLYVVVVPLLVISLLKVSPCLD